MLEYRVSTLTNPSRFWTFVLLTFLLLLFPVASVQARDAASKHPHLWIHPLEGADGAKVDEVQAVRVLNAIQQALSRLQGFQKLDLGPPAYVLPLGAPDPRTLLGASQLAQLGADYIVGHTLIPGRAGFLTLELYQPPQPRMIWMATQPLTKDSDLRQATNQLALQLAEHLQRLDSQILVAMTPMSALQAIAKAPATTESASTLDTPQGDQRYAIQVEASLAAANAHKTIKLLRTRGYEPRLEMAKDTEHHKWHYVRIGSYSDRNSAQTALQAFMEKEKMPAVLVMGVPGQKGDSISANMASDNNSDDDQEDETEDEEEEATPPRHLKAQRPSPRFSNLTRSSARSSASMVRKGSRHKARTESSKKKATATTFDIRINPSQVRGHPEKIMAWMRKKGYHPHVHRVRDSRRQVRSSVRLGPIRGKQNALATLESFRRRTGLKATVIPATK
ncbi:MAG: SPOR domain-containing protein [Magnetococcus sp. DMHC-1]